MTKPTTPPGGVVIGVATGHTPSRADKIIKNLGVVALVAGTIAAGASAAVAHAKAKRKEGV